MSAAQIAAYVTVIDLDLPRASRVAALQGMAVAEQHPGIKAVLCSNWHAEQPIRWARLKSKLQRLTVAK